MSIYLFRGTPPPPIPNKVCICREGFDSLSHCVIWSEERSDGMWLQVYGVKE